MTYRSINDDILISNIETTDGISYYNKVKLLPQASLVYYVFPCRISIPFKVTYSNPKWKKRGCKLDSQDFCQDSPAQIP